MSGLASAALVARSWTRTRERRTAGSYSRACAHVDALRLSCLKSYAAIERSFTSALGFPSAIFMPEGDRLCVSHHSSRFDPDRQ